MSRMAKVAVATRAIIATSFHFIVLPDTDVTWFGSQTAHSLPGQHPVPRPPPLRHPFSLKKT